MKILEASPQAQSAAGYGRYLMERMPASRDSEWGGPLPCREGTGGPSQSIQALRRECVLQHCLPAQLCSPSHEKPGPRPHSGAPTPAPLSWPLTPPPFSTQPHN